MLWSDIIYSLRRKANVTCITNLALKANIRPDTLCKIARGERKKVNMPTINKLICLTRRVMQKDEAADFIKVLRCKARGESCTRAYKNYQSRHLLLKTKSSTMDNTGNQLSCVL